MIVAAPETVYTAIADQGALQHLYLPTHPPGGR